MHLIALIATALVLATPASAASLSRQEKAAYACVLKAAKTELGNPMVKASNAAEKCRMDGLSQAQKEKVIGQATRRLMRNTGQRCIGTGCG